MYNYKASLSVSNQRNRWNKCTYYYKHSERTMYAELLCHQLHVRMSELFNLIVFLENFSKMLKLWKSCEFHHFVVSTDKFATTLEVSHLMLLRAKLHMLQSFLEFIFWRTIMMSSSTCQNVGIVNFIVFGWFFKNVRIMEFMWVSWSCCCYLIVHCKHEIEQLQLQQKTNN